MTSAWAVHGMEALVAAIMLLHVLAAPFTKVEESFNVQAMHDLLYHGTALDKYDHFEFPGVVPRTFIGSLLVSALSSPLVLLLHALRLPKYLSLITVRIVLGSLTLASFRMLRRQISREFGPLTAFNFCLLLASQFHLLFYCSRPLPNVFALALVNVAASRWIQGDLASLLSIMVFTFVVFRCDVVIFLGTIGLTLLLTKRISFVSAFFRCAAAAAASLAITVTVDSLLWRQLLWPEGAVLFFNTAMNKSKEWGVSSPLWYFTSALPRSLLAALPLSVAGALLDPRIRPLFVSSAAFVALYSFLPHKELRFIFPALPIFNLSAAVALSRIQVNSKKPQWRPLLLLSILGLAGSAAASLLFSLASYANYPGGHAMLWLHANAPTPGSVHVAVLPAMTGVSRFLEKPSPWSYSKNETIAPSQLALADFTFALSHEPSIVGYDRIHAQGGFTRIGLRQWLLFGIFPIPYPYMETQPKVYVHYIQESL